MKVAQQMQENEKEYERMANSRCWDTTNKADFQPKDLSENPIGKKVMKTRDNIIIPVEQRDEEFLVETNLGKRLPKSDLQKLEDQIPKGHYTATQPITFYTQHLERKNYYMSGATGGNPFGKSSGVTQIVDNTRAVRNYDGNVDFGRATKNMDTFLRSNQIYRPGQ